MRAIANNFTRLREVNAELVRTVLKECETATKADLAAATGLSVATVGNILADMVRSGEAVEAKLGPPEGGRPPRLYAYAAGYSLTALVFPKAEAGGKYIVYEVVDAKGGVIEKSLIRLKIADRKAIDVLVRKLRSRHASLKALALSIPGVVRDGRVEICDLPELEGVEVAGYLAEEHGLAVVAENDMNLAALGYYSRCLGASGGSVAYVVVPRKNCTGAGLVVDGRLVRGQTSFAGELSFIPFGVSRERQFAGLEPQEAFAYTAKVATAAIAVLNPTVLVVASELVDAVWLERLRRVCVEHIPAEHMPELAGRPAIDDDCLAGLALVAASSLGAKIRLVEDG